MLREINVPEIADLLKHAETGDPKACLLIGAGVSFTAGIGLANDFIERIKRDFPAIFAKACGKCPDLAQPNYAQCMAELPPALQVQLVRKDIDAAKINWAHVGIARMERQGIIDTILTPNFDPLASRACALFNRFPAIYDLAGLRDAKNQRISFDKSFVKGSAIFHLHGQHTGFLLLNTAEKLLEQAKRIRPVLDAVMKGRPVIIAGYSGENDPLIDEIAALAPFNHGLFWVCHDESDPAPNVREKLLSLDDCYIVRNMPGDKFFTDLANALKLEAPGFLATPFDHMLRVLQTLRPYSDVGDGAGDDLLVQASQQLEIARVEQTTARPERAKIATLMATEQFEAVWQQYGTNWQSLDAAEHDLVAWAAMMIGNALLEQANKKQGEEAVALYVQAGEKYASALAIKPDMHDALNNWGNVLLAQANEKQGEEADALYALAGEKYAGALTIKPDKHQALYNWGGVFSSQAKKKQGEEAEALFAQAGEKYAAALAIKPDKHEALNNWGSALSDQANKKQGEEADALFAQAIEKYAAALAIKPDLDDVLHNWGSVLSDQADKKQGEEADALFAQAGEKYAAALAIKSDKHEALNNWGSALLVHANKKQGEEADALFAQAVEKYAAALAIKPDMHDALNNWGRALSDQADKKQGEEADALFAQAGEKYAAALAIKPDLYEALNNWGSALLTQANKKQSEEADALFAQAIEKYAAALAIKPDMHDALNNWGGTLFYQANKKQGEEADALYAQAGEKYAAALAIKPDKHEALSNWGSALSSQASKKRGDAADALYSQANDKFNEGEAILPGCCAYNQACLAGLQGNATRAALCLERSKAMGVDWPGCEHFMADADFDSVRKSAEFKKAMATVGCA